MADFIAGESVMPGATDGSRPGLPVRWKDMGDGTFAQVISTSGGGGGGASLSDVLLTDSNGILFVGRDGGGTTGTIFTYYRLDTQAAYTPVGTIKAAGNNVVTVADGADVTQGAIADAAVAAGASGTVGAKVRAISRDVGATAANGATAALQTAGNASLAALATNSPTVGQKAMAGSVPVTLASDQGPVTVTGSVSTTPPTDIFVAATNVTAQNTNPNSGTPTANSTVSVTLTGGQNLVTANISANALGASITAQVTYDGLNWTTLSAYVIVNSNPLITNTSSTIATGTTGQYQWQVGGAKGFRLSANTATVSGTLTASLNASVAATPLVTNVQLSQIGSGTAAVLPQVGGSSLTALGAFLGAPTTITDYNAASWSAASGTGATITDVAGAVCAFDINLSAWTTGSSTGLDVFFESSRDGGTTWDLHWQCESLSAVGHVSTPALLVSGARRRWRWVNRGGAATTATVTVTCNRGSVVPIRLLRQFYDRTAGLITNPTLGATTTGWINGAATAGAGYETGGASTISAEISVGTAATPGAYQLQVCSFNSTSSADWVSVGSPVTAVASSAVRTSYTGVTERFFRVICSTAGASQTGNYIALTAS